MSKFCEACGRENPAEALAKLASVNIGQAAEIERLRLIVDDITNAHRVVMDEACGADERHCTCVPILRSEIEQLWRMLAAADARTGEKIEEIGHNEELIAHLRAELADALKGGKP